MADAIELSNLQIDLARQTLDYIEANELNVDTHITESMLHSKFNVSRTPIRAVLAYLSQVNVLRYQQNKGYYVDCDQRKIVSVKSSLPAKPEDELYVKIIHDCGTSVLNDVVTETELIKRYAIKRSTLLKVLQRLNKNGVVRREQGHGWRIMAQPYSKKISHDSYNYRLAIEPAAMLIDTYKVDHKQLEKIKQEQLALLNKSDTVLSQDDSKRAETMIEIFDMNSRFHEMLVSFSHNQFFIEAIKNQNRLRRVTEYQYMHEHDNNRIKDSCLEHLQIIDALEKGDVKWAATLLKRHLDIVDSLPSD